MKLKNSAQRNILAGPRRVAMVGVVAGVATMAILVFSFTKVQAVASGMSEVVSGISQSIIVKALSGIKMPSSASVESETAANKAGSWQSAGAHLPINYDVSSLSGKVQYVATNGNDGNSGNVSAPYATLAKAYATSSANDTIVLRGGEYRQGNITITPAKPVKVIAYPGETPVFNGASKVSGGWTDEGALKYRSYSAMPVTNGSGINFTSGQNLAGAGDGKFPDQAWVGATQLKQVQTKGAVSAGTFYVEGGRLYMAASDIAKGNVEVSSLRNFMSIQAPGTVLEGIKVTRYSNSANDYGVIKLNGSADKVLIRNVELTDAAFIAMTISGGGDLNDGTTLKNVTIANSNWMGVNPNYTDNLTFDQVLITNMNQWNEFTYSPQSGAIKTSRTRYTKVIDSQIRDNKSHGVWFDQSNYDAQVAGNVITDNAGSAVFFEISDNLLLINNYIRTLPSGDRAVKLAGSSGLKLINNTIVGGADPIGIYVDNRSKPGCANPAQPLCANSYGSDRDTVRPYLASMDWMPRLDMMVNNIIVYPKGAGYCGVVTTVCITQSNSGANAPLNMVIHSKTVISGNVYANGTGTIVATPVGKYATPSSFAAAMAKAPVNMSNLEENSLQGDSYVASDGTPTEKLYVLHSKAAGVPTNATINKYLPADTKHYGAVFK